MKIRISYPNQNKMATIELPNFEYLPLFYLFPKKLLKSECSRLVDMPRSIHGIFTHEEWFTTLASDFFLQAVCDLTAYYVWPTFGISTYMECFSGNDPLWRLAHALSIWKRAFEHMSGITAQGIAYLPKKEHPWINEEEFLKVMLKIGHYGIMENKLLHCIQAIRETRCFEDYDSRNSNAKIDFHRKWYHTRSKIKSVSLDQLTDNELGDGSYGNSSIQYEDAVYSKIYTEKFYLNLKPLDREILELRIKGYTYQEIAGKTVYKTHSAVLKRINRIAEQYLDYTDEHEKLKSLND